MSLELIKEKNSSMILEQKTKMTGKVHQNIIWKQTNKQTGVQARTADKSDKVPDALTCGEKRT